MKTILVIDDELAILDMLKAALANLGYHVVTAQGGFKAVQILDEIYVHLIITDVIMPDLDGIELVRLIRSKRGHYIPIIGMSGMPSMLGSPDFDGILRKPFSMKTLADLVKQHIAPEPMAASSYPLPSASSMG